MYKLVDKFCIPSRICETISDAECLGASASPCPSKCGVSDFSVRPSGEVNSLCRRNSCSSCKTVRSLPSAARALVSYRSHSASKLEMRSVCCRSFSLSSSISFRVFSLSLLHTDRCTWSASLGLSRSRSIRLISFVICSWYLSGRTCSSIYIWYISLLYQVDPVWFKDWPFLGRLLPRYQFPINHSAICYLRGTEHCQVFSPY